MTAGDTARRISALLSALDKPLADIVATQALAENLEDLNEPHVVLCFDPSLREPDRVPAVTGPYPDRIAAQLAADAFNAAEAASEDPFIYTISRLFPIEHA